MKDHGAQSTTSTGRLRNSLVGLQVAVCMLLLLAAGLLLHGLYHAQTTNPGFRMDNVEAVAFDLSEAGYTPARAAIFQQALRERVAALPGVDAVAQSIVIPLAGNHDDTGFSGPDGRNTYEVEYNIVSPGFFSLLRIPILQGRNFTEAEARTGAHVLILTQSTARRFFPGQDVLGQVLHRGNLDWQVIGIAADAQVADLGNSSKLYLFEPTGPANQDSLNLMVHSRGGRGITKEIAAVIGDLDPNLAVNIAPLADNLEQWWAPARVASALSVILGALALLLASIGVYGMVSYGVSRRVREIGIRRALGAGNTDVMWLVIRQAMLPVAIGALVGIILCGGVSSIFSAILFGVSPLDPGSFVSMPSFLLAVALLACYIPARRAMTVDPIVALRHE